MKSPGGVTALMTMKEPSLPMVALALRLMYALFYCGHWFMREDTVYFPP